MTTERNAVAVVGWGLFAAVLIVLWSNCAVAQTTFGTGTQVVIPTAANISVYHTQVFVRNPNPAPILVNVRYYQSINGTPPAGLRACTPLSLQANQSSSFDLGVACALTGANDDFGMIILEDAAGTNPIFGYSRTQTPSGIGFSVEGFPIDNFTGASADVLGLQKLSAAPNYRSNCFVGALAQPVNWQLQLIQSGTETVLATTGGSLQPYQTTRILDVFASLGLAGDFANVRATFTTSDNPAPAFIRFCTLETSSNGSADFRIAKSNIGSVADAFVQNGNAFGTTARLGTTENQPLELFSNNQRALRIEPNATSPNIIGGHSNNGVMVGLSVGATIAGGGEVGTDCFEPSTGLFTRHCGNRALNLFGTVAGGAANLANGNTSTVGGGGANTANGDLSTVAGGFANTAGGLASTVAGGGLDETNCYDPPTGLTRTCGNRALADFAMVGGGQANLASGGSSFVAGGISNTASAAFSSVGGGENNTASNGHSTVAGGLNNTASGAYSTVAGGWANVAIGNYSFAAGTEAQASTEGCAIFGLWTTQTPFTCQGVSHLFRIGADHGLDVSYFGRSGEGGSRFVYMGDFYAGDSIRVWNGAHLTDGGAWTNASDRDQKENFAAIDAREILARSVALPVMLWNYKREPGVRRLGPVAQDFYAAFGLGADDKSISTVDAAGVALAAIQGLHELVSEKDARVEALERRLRGQQQELANLREMLESLLAKLGRDSRLARGE